MKLNKILELVDKCELSTVKKTEDCYQFSGIDVDDKFIDEAINMMDECPENDEDNEEFDKNIITRKDAEEKFENQISISGNRIFIESYLKNINNDTTLLIKHVDNEYSVVKL